MQMAIRLENDTNNPTHETEPGPSTRKNKEKHGINVKTNHTVSVFFPT